MVLFVLHQGTQVKDVIIKPDGPKALLLNKHADYIAAYGSKNDDYVSVISNLYYRTLHSYLHDYVPCVLALKSVVW